MEDGSGPGGGVCVALSVANSQRNIHSHLAKRAKKQLLNFISLQYCFLFTFKMGGEEGEGKAHLCLSPSFSSKCIVQRLVPKPL